MSTSSSSTSSEPRAEYSSSVSKLVRVLSVFVAGVFEVHFAKEACVDFMEDKAAA